VTRLGFMSKRVALEIQGELDALHLIWTLLDQVMGGISDPPPPKQERYNTLVAVQEAVTNVLRHSYGGDLSRPFRVELVIEGNRLTITLVDFGPPFDPTVVEVQPDESKPGEGGYGIFFMRTVMNQIRYSREDGANILVMVKIFTPEPSPAGSVEGEKA